MLRLLLLLLVVTTAAHAAPDDAPQTIEIRALRNPVDKSYRKMVKGMALFQQRHAMAPQATLRYKLLPRKPGTDIDDIRLHVIGRSVDLPVKVAADHTFTLERSQKALDEDALVRSERRAQTMTWRAEIRTPGLPPDTRRLGDLRLECQVGMEAGLVSHYPLGLETLLAWMLDTPDFCNKAYTPYLFFADQPLFGVTLTAGERKERLSVGNLYAGIAQGRTKKSDLPYCDCEALLDRAYTLPLGDRSWPDDTLVTLEPMAAPSQADEASAANDAILVGSTKPEVASSYGRAAVVHFDSGFEVWAYQYAGTEFILLFDPLGRVAKTRVRAQG